MKHLRLRRFSPDRRIQLYSQLPFSCSESTIETHSKWCEICSKLTIKTPEWGQWHRSGVFIVNFEHISDLFLVFLFLTLKKQISPVYIMYACKTTTCPINLFHVTVLFTYPILPCQKKKKTETLWFFQGFREYRKWPVVWNGSITSDIHHIHHILILKMILLSSHTSILTGIYFFSIFKFLSPADSSARADTSKYLTLNDTCISESCFEIIN